MKFKDSLKLFNYVYQNKVFFVVIIIFFFNCLMHFFSPMGLLLLGLMASISSTYFVNITYQAMVSGMVQSSEKVRKSVLKHFTIIMLISNLFHFALFILPKYFFIVFTGDNPGREIAIFLINYMLYNILTFISVALLYKKQVLGIVILGIMVLIMLIQFPQLMTLTAEKFQNSFLGLPQFTGFSGTANVGLLLAATAVCIISPFIYYIISKAMQNVPISKSYMDRQPWGKL